MNARDLRGQYEERYDAAILNDDIIETIAEQFSHDASHMGCDPFDIIDEQRKLACTLEWNTIYNALNSETI